MLENIDTALSNGVIDSYDILFVKDANGKPYVGWIDKEGNKVVCDDTKEFAKLESLIATKINADEVDAKVNAKIETIGKDYEISHKPDGVLVDYRDKEIRVMCPADTEWALQNSGEGADKNKYYIGFKAYAPKDAVNFKEDLSEVIADDTMYSFEGNDFAGVDAQGRKYSIVWLPVAVYDESSKTWTYHGAKSGKEKYIGWYYSVEWYNADGKIITADCIRINLSNEGCHFVAAPYYVGVIEKKFEEIETKIEDNSAYEIVEF
jgi:hypothetical protein